MMDYSQFTEEQKKIVELVNDRKSFTIYGRHGTGRTSALLVAALIALENNRFQEVIYVAETLPKVDKAFEQTKDYLDEEVLWWSSKEGIIGERTIIIEVSTGTETLEHPLHFLTQQQFWSVPPPSTFRRRLIIADDNALPNYHAPDEWTTVVRVRALNSNDVTMPSLQVTSSGESPVGKNEPSEEVIREYLEGREADYRDKVLGSLSEPSDMEMLAEALNRINERIREQGGLLESIDAGSDELRLGVTLCSRCGGGGIITRYGGINPPTRIDCPDCGGTGRAEEWEDFSL